jgi:hypothetical protein
MPFEAESIADFFGGAFIGSSSSIGKDLTFKGLSVKESVDRPDLMQSPRTVFFINLLNEYS